MLYLLIIIFGTLLVGIIDGLFFASSFFGGIICATLTTVSVIAIDGIFAFAIRRLPQSWFGCQKKLFAVSKKEREFYRAIKLNSWKDHIPELGGFTSFHKDKLVSGTDREYLERFILESNYGVMIHLSNAIFGILIVFLPFAQRADIWLPIFIINFILSVLPMMILRYHLPVLERLYARSVRS